MDSQESFFCRKLFEDSLGSSEADIAEWAHGLVFCEVGFAFRAVPSHNRHPYGNSDANVALTPFDERVLQKLGD